MASAQRSARVYRSDRRQAQARLTRQRVIDSATEVFLESGYAATTVREIATRAGVAVPTVELLFGTKPRLLKAAIDVLISGDDEPVAVLDRDWATTVVESTSVDELLSIAVAVVAAAQVRSAGLVLAVFKGARRDAELAELATQLFNQRAVTATRPVDRLTRLTPLSAGCDREQAIDTVWLLMDSAVFDRLTRRRHWSVDQYEAWFADSVRRLLVGSAPHSPTTPRRRTK